jgi:hypothetical protein
MALRQGGARRCLFMAARLEAGRRAVRSEGFGISNASTPAAGVEHVSAGNSRSINVQLSALAQRFVVHQLHFSDPVSQ